MFGLFGAATKKQDTEVAEMLLVTLASYKKTFLTLGQDFMVGTIKRYPGVEIMTDRPGELLFRFSNELSPFVFAAMSVGETNGVSAVAGPPYDGFSVTMGLKEGGGFVVSRAGRGRPATARGKYLADLFVAKGAGLMP